jgi:hypothetical protein
MSAWNIWVAAAVDAALTGRGRVGLSRETILPVSSYITRCSVGRCAGQESDAGKRWRIEREVCARAAPARQLPLRCGRLAAPGPPDAAIVRVRAQPPSDLTRLAWQPGILLSHACGINRSDRFCNFAVGNGAHPKNGLDWTKQGREVRIAFWSASRAVGAHSW